MTDKQKNKTIDKREQAANTTEAIFIGCVVAVMLIDIMSIITNRGVLGVAISAPILWAFVLWVNSQLRRTHRFYNEMFEGVRSVTKNHSEQMQKLIEEQQQELRKTKEENAQLRRRLALYDVQRGQNDNPISNIKP
jgi:hypothetical protein